MLKSFGWPSTRSAMLPASRWIPSSRAHEAAAVERRAVERLRAIAKRLGVAEHVPLLGQSDQLGPSARRLAHEALGSLEVAALVGR